MDADEVIVSNAPRQHGLVTLEQLRAAGVNDSMMSRGSHQDGCSEFVRVCTWFPVPQTFEAAVLAAVLSVGPDTVASHASAAALWGFPFVEPDGLVLTTARRRWGRLPGVRSQRTVAFLRCERTVHRRVPVTTVARTIVDLSGRFSVARLGRITDHALRKGKLRLRDLRRCAAGLPPAPGRRMKRIEALLTRRLPGFEPGDSDLEMRFVRALMAAGLPELPQQHRVTIGTSRCRIDLAYPDKKVAVELDGWDTHRTRSAFDEDRARANDLVVAGWHVLRFTSSMSDDQAVATVRAALDRCHR